MENVKFLGFTFGLALAFVISCAPNGPHQPINGGTGLVTSSYAEVRPIFATYCSACHPSRSSPNWLDYGEAKAYVNNGKLLSRVILERSMPPAGSPQAAAISEHDRQVIADWVHAGGPNKKATVAQSPQTTSSTEKLIEQCLGCHGVAGPASANQPVAPRLHGQSEHYLAAQLFAFKWRDRIDPTQGMNQVAAEMSDNEIALAAAYFSKLDGLAPRGAEPLTNGENAFFSRGQALAETNCVSCHMNTEFGGRPSSPDLPLLAGQSKRYLLNQLLLFRNTERKSPLMNEMTKNLSNADLDGLAAYFATGSSGPAFRRRRP
jgi:cytochrome c553